MKKATHIYKVYGLPVRIVKEIKSGYFLATFDGNDKYKPMTWICASKDLISIKE